VFIQIYQPVWADTMAPEKYKSLWITFLLLGAPLGIVLGYAVTFMVSDDVTGEGWEWAFRIQGMALSPFIVLLILIPKKYMNLEEALDKKNDLLKEVQ